MADNCSWAVVPAAGKGNRFGQPMAKQYVRLHGRSILDYSISTLLNACANISVFVAIADDDERWEREAIAAHPQVHRVSGGSSRAASVQAGLQAVSEKANDNDLVLVHDAARPCVGVDDVQALISIAADHEVGALLACPVTDTLKRVDAERRVVETADRSTLYQALTPQAFRVAMLLNALQEGAKANAQVTDEASAMELAGHSPLICLGARSNIKVTFPEDQLFAEAYLGAYAVGAVT